jgi:hypothetical protein
MRIRALARTAAVAVAVLLLAPGAGAEPADTGKVLKELGFPADAIAKVKAGEMVHADLKSSDERELAVGLAFMVKVSPQELAGDMMGGLLLKVDKDVMAHGNLTGDGSVDQFAGLKLGELTQKYQKAKPGGDLNLSAAEVKALQALKGKPASAVEAEVHKQLLARYQAYRSSGLDGIAPYARGGDKRSGAADLRSAAKAASPMKAAAPGYYDTVLNYPKKPASGFKEVYNWQLYKAHGEPTVILTHGFTVNEGDAFHALQRQYYVSGGYNVEQAMAGFLPAAGGGTLVVYVNRTSTDQVAGFGGGTKRSMGKKLMASQLEGLYTKVEKAADK